MNDVCVTYIHTKQTKCHTLLTILLKLKNVCLLSYSIVIFGYVPCKKDDNAKKEKVLNRAVELKDR